MEHPIQVPAAAVLLPMAQPVAVVPVEMAVDPMAELVAIKHPARRAVPLRVVAVVVLARAGLDKTVARVVSAAAAVVASALADLAPAAAPLAAAAVWALVAPFSSRPADR